MSAEFDQPPEPLALESAEPSFATARTRMSPEQRRDLILERATAVFAERGFSVSTRELAAALGVTQPLLYRYFPSKDALIDTVFDKVFFRPWNPEWEAWLADRQVALRDRLRRYLKDYSTFITDRTLVRLHMHAGLVRPELTHRFIDKLRSTHFKIIIDELRHSHGLPARPDPLVGDLEAELVWATHSSVFYLGVRRWIYALPPSQNVDRLIDLIVDTFLSGAPEALRALSAETSGGSAR